MERHRHPFDAAFEPAVLEGLRDGQARTAFFARQLDDRRSALLDAPKAQATPERALPKDLATLHAWVVNAPSLKPGTLMPRLDQLTGPELHDLVAYLQSLS